jgi:hypothetical protein
VVILTAEVAIINSCAVAIAADSAVTIGNGNKIYNSALKVFSLSKVGSVGIMIYGNATLLGLPWETIIKVYRDNLKCTTFRTLEEYCENFFNFINNNKNLFSDKEQDFWMKSNISGYFKVIVDEICKKSKNEGNFDLENTIKIVSDVITQHHNSLAPIPYCEGIDGEFEESVKDHIRPLLDEDLIKPVFQSLPLNNELVELLLSIASGLLTRQIFSEAKTGIVICGFGDDDLYPVVCTHEVDGYFLGKAKCIKDQEKTMRVSNGMSCSIIPFAQDDMVRTFMEGMNPLIARFINGYLTELFSEVPNLIYHNQIKKHISKKEIVHEVLKQSMEILLKNFFDKLLPNRPMIAHF